MRCAASVLAALAVLLCGCTLIDQRTFEGKARKPDAAGVAKAALPPLPFVTIRMDDPDADFRPELAEAVEAAQAKKPDVEFEVLAPYPTTATPAVQEEFTRNGQADAETIATALGYDGVSLDRVHVGFRGDPGIPPREIRIYVR